MAHWTCTTTTRDLAKWNLVGCPIRRIKRTPIQLTQQHR